MTQPPAEVLADEVAYAEAMCEVVAAAKAWAADNVSGAPRLRTAVMKINAIDAAAAWKIAADRKSQEPA